MKKIITFSYFLFFLGTASMYGSLSISARRLLNYTPNIFNHKCTSFHHMYQSKQNLFYQTYQSKKMLLQKKLVQYNSVIEKAHDIKSLFNKQNKASNLEEDKNKKLPMLNAFFNAPKDYIVTNAHTYFSKITSTWNSYFSRYF